MTSHDLSDGAVHLPKITLKTYSGWRPHDAAQLLERMTDAVAAADLPLKDGMEGLERLMNEVDLGFRLERGLPVWRRRLLTPLLMPSVGTAGAIFGRLEAERGALLAAIAVERQRARTGAMPENFEQLVPDELPSLPIDPFTGGPLRYVRDENGYTIYSVGRDREDQGGLVHDPHGKQPDFGVRIEIGGGESEQD